MEVPGSLCLPGSLQPRKQPSETPERRRYLINFGDYVGQARLGDAEVLVLSAKLDPDGFDRLLQEVTSRIADLPFDYQTPTFVPFDRTSIEERDFAYHALLYLRWAMWTESPGLREHWEQIANDPQRVLIQEEREAAVHEVRTVTPRMIEGLAAEGYRWGRADTLAGTRDTALTSLTQARLGRALFPLSAREQVARTSLDTPENRFLRYFIELATELIRSALDLLERTDAAAKPPDAGVLRTGQLLLSELQAMGAAGFLADVGRMQVFPSHSQVLQKRSGYREILRHYLALVLASRYPIAARDLTLLIEAKSASLLYEYWTFFRVADLLTDRLGPPSEAVRINVGESSVALREGIRLKFESDVELSYNPTFAGNLGGSYSVRLRPDIGLRVGEQLHLFDAKFRVERPPAPSDDAVLEDPGEVLDRTGTLPEGWAKQADLHKMHTYKDAIGHWPDERRGGRPQVETVWVLYPGSEFVFYDEARGRLALEDVEDGLARLFGVGALPLVPGLPTDQLGLVLQQLLP
ncbi:MAG TPA: DUF2357 domain-containing protein [Thermoleophilia bacterium]|nr:DUF2357 domain-containing protein [Thermoleophilia bacterium]